MKKSLLILILFVMGIILGSKAKVCAEDVPDEDMPEAFKTTAGFVQMTDEPATEPVPEPEPDGEAE